MLVSLETKAYLLRLYFTPKNIIIHLPTKWAFETVVQKFEITFISIKKQLNTIYN